MTDFDTDVLIIGAGQAGIALAYRLKATPLRSLLLERHDRIGTSWRNRYDSLTLFTPRSLSALADKPLAGDPLGYATRDEFAAYLEAYVEQFSLPVLLQQSIVRLERVNGGFHATNEVGRVFSAPIVALATGAFQRPKIPTLAAQFSPDVQQLTAETYRNPAQVETGSVLIVGDGATGRDVAKDLAGTRDVYLATGRSRRLFPERILGRSTWSWLDQLGMLRVSAASPLGGYMRRVDPFPARGNRLQQLRRKGVRVMPSLAKVLGKQVWFADGATVEIDSVIWATGYRDESDWVAIPEVKDAQGNFIHDKGVSPLPNLYFIGRSWQRTRGSALIMGVDSDAAYLTRIIRANYAPQ